MGEEYLHSSSRYRPVSIDARRDGQGDLIQRDDGRLEAASAGVNNKGCEYAGIVKVVKLAVPADSHPMAPRR